MIILDEATLLPLRTVTFDEAGVENVVIDWPRQNGKRNLVGEVTIETPFTQALFSALAPLFAAQQARVEHALRRLADDLRIPIPLARQDFHSVLRVLEDAGVADGYGRLAIPQPVRPAAPPWPANLRARRPKGTP
jgi:hypothetical protein